MSDIQNSTSGCVRLYVLFVDSNGNTASLMSCNTNHATDVT